MARRVDVERVETDTEFAMVKSKIFKIKAEARPLTIRNGKRVHLLCDPVRKRYKAIDSDDSEWDELEAEIFGHESREPGKLEPVRCHTI